VAECVIEAAEAGPSLSPILHLDDGFREGLNPTGCLSLDISAAFLIFRNYPWLLTQITCVFLAIPSRERGRWPSSLTLGRGAVDANALLTNGA